MDTTITPHPYSKLMLIITGIVLLLTLIGVGFYTYKIGKLKFGKKSSQVAVTTQTETKTEPTTAQQSSTVGETAAPTAVTTQTAEVKKDLSDIDVSEIKKAVADLKTQLGAFNK